MVVLVDLGVRIDAAKSTQLLGRRQGSTDILCPSFGYPCGKW